MKLTVQEFLNILNYILLNPIFLKNIAFTIFVAKCAPFCPTNLTEKCLPF